MPKKHAGGCAFDAVRFEFDTDPGFVAMCHCLDCKKATGGEAATFFGLPDEDFTLLSASPKGYSYTAASGKRLERMFCPDCGARLYTRNLESFPGLVFVTIGSLDDAGAFVPMLEMFTKRRLAWAKPLDLPQFPDMPT